MELLSLRVLHNRVLISFIREKLLSTDVVVTGIVRRILAIVLRLGNIVFIMSLTTTSFLVIDSPSSVLACFGAP